MNVQNNQSWPEIWDDVFSSQEWGKYPGESLIRFIARNFYNKKRNDVRLLEVGCGPGANIWYLAREGFQVYGIDGSEKAIEIAKNRLHIEKLSASLLVGDIVNLPYEENYFDAVIDNECIYCNNFDNSIKIFEDINRILKPDGLFYSRTFTDEMYIGKSNVALGRNEYSDISDGPLAGKGFVRLIDRQGIHDLYEKKFEPLSIDKSEYSINSGKELISEWIVISKKIAHE